MNVPKLPGFVIVNVPPCDVVGEQPLRPRALGDVGDRARHAEQVEALGVLHDRDDQALAALERDREAEVDEAPASRSTSPRSSAFTHGQSRSVSTVARATNAR